MEYYNSDNKRSLRWATLAVLLYVVLLVVLMVTIRFSLAETDPAAEGILVEFGETLDGDGQEEIVATDISATTPPPPQPQEEPLESDPNEDITLKTEQNEVKSQQEVPQVEQPIEQRDTVVVEERIVNQNALFPGRKEQSTSTSQGTTDIDGNQGVQSGTQEGEATQGGGSGEESFAQLKDRSIVGQLPKPSYAANAAGRVMIDITVDEEGHVKSATYRAQGSTTNNSQLVAAAQEAALKARFTPSDNFIQGGTITYIFKMN
ncbi:MAG: TonB family protein [Rikenellaceae bacterium]